MRAIWSGGISFGLIYIPVKLYNATKSENLDFDLLTKKSHHLIGYAKIDKETGEEVDDEDIVRGFQVEKGKYVIVDDDDFEKANVKKTRSIEILAFTDRNEIDPKYFERPYYLEPEEGAEKTYSLFLEALKKSGRVGISRFVLREREHLAILKPEDNYLLLNQMRFAAEISPATELKLPHAQKHEKEELDTAVKIIVQMSKPFRPENYKDSYTEELLHIIKEKAVKQKVEARGEAPSPTHIKDLMQSLKKSLKLASSAK